MVSFFRRFFKGHSFRNARADEHVQLGFESDV